MTIQSQTEVVTGPPPPGGGRYSRDEKTQLLNSLQHLVGISLTRYGGLLLLAVFIAFFSIQLPSIFLTSATFNSIVGDQSVTAILALGLLVTLAVGQFDLSAAQNLGMCAVLCSSLMVNQNMNPILAVVSTLLAGVLVGLINGVFVAIIGINSLIATLGMSSVLLAFTELVSNFQFIGPVPSGFQNAANHEVAQIPLVAFYAVALALLVWYLLEHTPAGRRAYAVGANPEASRLAGVRTTRYVFGSFVATGGLAAVAGVLVTAKIGNVAPTLGPAYMLPCFAACFLGTTQIKVGRFNVGGTVIALLLLATGVKGLQLMGNQLWVTDLFNGLALLVAVSAAVLSSKRGPRSKL